MNFSIIGNAGSGKSTLAGRKASASGSRLLDLDSIFWETGQVAVPRQATEAAEDLRQFCAPPGGWVVEGCYSALIRQTLHHRPYLMFLDPGLEQCVANCKARPWEPHKYRSKAEQDARLDFLLAWVTDYYTRDGDMSWAEHRRLFDGYDGPKLHLQRLPEDNIALPFQASAPGTPS